MEQGTPLSVNLDDSETPLKTRPTFSLERIRRRTRVQLRTAHGLGFMLKAFDAAFLAREEDSASFSPRRNRSTIIGIPGCPIGAESEISPLRPKP